MKVFHFLLLALLFSSCVDSRDTNRYLLVESPADGVTVPERFKGRVLLDRKTGRLFFLTKTGEFSDLDPFEWVPFVAAIPNNTSEKTGED